MDLTADDILITTGSQQGLEFSAKLFLNKGDAVICESPSYLGAINAFAAYEPKFVEVEMDEEGIIISELEKALKENPDAKMIYTIPDFQNPTGNDHISKIREVYGKRRDLMLECMDKYFPAEVKHTNPYGGLFAWVELRDDLDAAKIMEECIKENVAYVPGEPFFPTRGRKNFFRVNYSCMPDDKIIEGVKRIGKVLNKYYEK